MRVYATKIGRKLKTKPVRKVTRKIKVKSGRRLVP